MMRTSDLAFRYTELKDRIISQESKSYDERQTDEVSPAHRSTRPDDRYAENTGNPRQGVWNSPIFARNPHAPWIRAENIHLSRNRTLGRQTAAGGSGMGRFNLVAEYDRRRSSSAFPRCGAEDYAESESRGAGWDAA